ncbi:unnamed protein product [Rotaria socialis]
MNAWHRTTNKLPVSRTNPEQFAIIQQFLTKFYLHEITFLVHLDSIYSVYDAERAERITAQLRSTFGFDHNISDVSPHEIPHVPDISLMHLADGILTSNYTTNSSKNVTSHKQSNASVLENSTTTILTKKRKTVTLQNDSQQQQKQATGVYSKTDWSAQVERIIKQSSSIKENF